MDNSDGITWNESSGRSDVRNPRSSALGLGQFVDATWLDMIRRYRPDLVQGKSRAEILELRKDPVLSRQMTAAYAAENDAKLRQAGLPVTPGSTYLMHFAGPSGAVKLLNADPNTPVESLLSAEAIKANPLLQGKTASWVIAWANKRMAMAAAASKPKPQDTQATPYVTQAQELNPAFSATSWLQSPTSPNVLLPGAAPPFAPSATAPRVAPVPFVQEAMNSGQALHNALAAPGAAPWALSDRFGTWNDTRSVSGPAAGSGGNGDRGQIDDGNSPFASEPRPAYTDVDLSSSPASARRSGDAAGVSVLDPSSVRSLNSRILGTMPVDPNQPPRAADPMSGIAGGLPSLSPVWRPSEALLAALDRNRAPDDWVQRMPFRSPAPSPQDAPGGIPGMMVQAGLIDPRHPDAPPGGGLVRLLQDWMRNNPDDGVTR